MKLQKKNELKEKIKKNKENDSNHGLKKFSLSDDRNDFSNNISNGNVIGKLSIIENNFDGENDAFGKLNVNKNAREHEYYEYVLIELKVTNNQLNVIKEVFKELEKKIWNC